MRINIVRSFFFDVSVEVLKDEIFFKKLEEIVREVIDIKVIGRFLKFKRRFKLKLLFISIIFFLGVCIIG